MFGDRIYRPREWPRDRAVIDGLGERPIKEITGLFTAVGFSSPPSWIKPYHVLSNGEQFRCDLAAGAVRRTDRETRAAARGPPLVVFDEFTSVVDRNVARVVSAAIAKAHAQRADRRPVRGRHLPLRRDRVARAGLGDRHGHGDFHPEVSSATADRA